MEKVETISPKANQAFKSTAEQLIEKGLAKGIEKGIYQKSVEMVIALHQENFTIQKIAVLVGLSEKEVEEIIRKAF